MRRTLISLRFKWSRFIIFWLLFTLLFSINDFLWRYYSEKILDPLYPLIIFVASFLNPFQIIIRIKSGIYDFNAMITFLLIFFFSFLVSFLEIRLKGFRIGKAKKGCVDKYKRRCV